MFCQNLILDAVEAVLAWDLADDALPRAVNAQTHLLAGCYFD